MDATFDKALLPEDMFDFVEEAWLLGQPPLHRYLNYVKEAVVGGSRQTRGSLIDEWRVANDYYYDLEASEGGLPDKIEIRDIDTGELGDELRRDRRYQRAFDGLPTRIATVELDLLVVSQPHVDLDHARRLQTRLGPKPDPRQLFQFCLPVNGVEAPVHIRRLGSKRFQFWSHSSDFRFHEAVLLERDQVSGYDPYGPLGPILSLMVGYGSNFLNAIQSENRLLLHNGHHRAYALREMGITHAPCIVRTVTRRDELNLVASTDVASDPGFYFKAVRPPLLKDFFDPKLRKIVRVTRPMRMVEVTFEVKEHEFRDRELGA